ncbi:MAG: hypothetical protein E6I58_13965 [Chloroflexi bacterium]|jgi:hypothetical protein|nr:MAG: hypothetical protein E6J05_08870 [Chloroflexota bacterium]TME53968.1 MAG: hypothetical protein E6I58_13965 [Chloroflexota bacterium]
MNREYVWAIVGGVIVAVIGIGLLYLGASGAMPKAFGLFDMSNLGVRAVVTAILIVVAVGLFLAYRGTAGKPKP